MSLERDSAAIGALIATGVSRRDVMLMVLAPSAIVALVGGAIGYLLSLAFPLEEVAASEGFYSIPYIPIISHPAILAYCLLAPVLVCTIINALQIRKQLGKTVLSLLRGEPDASVRRGDILAQRLGGDNSHAVHILSHLFREKGIVVAMLVGTVLAAIIFMLGRGVGAYCGSIEQRLPEEVRYQYVYELPEEQSVPPAQGSIALKHAFAVEDHGFVRDIDFIGIKQDNPYFDVDADALDGGIAMSTATASRFGLSEGDEFTVYNGVTGEEHTFLVKQMTDYSVALSVFMDIDDMRALLGENDASYNTVFSDEPLNYPKSQLKNALRKIDYISPLEKLGPVVASSRDTFYLLAILLYVVTMLYLMRFAVTRGIREIGVLCSLGFHAGEICVIFTMGMIVLSVLVAAVGLWIAYGISQLLMPYLVASTPIGLMIDYPLSEFLVNMLFACCVIALSFALAAWSVRKFDIVQFLRSRE